MRVGLIWPPRLTAVRWVLGLFALLAGTGLPTPAPAASSIGSRIAFEQGGNVWTISPNGSDQKQVTTPFCGNFGCFGAGGPAFSPGGDRIAFSVGTVTGSDIWTVRPDGTDLQQLTNSSDHPSYDWDPAYSPSSGRIAFARQLETFGPYNFDIFTMRADGTDQRRLIDHWRFDLSPAYSPSGRRIAFESNSRIFTARSDGSRLRH
jgi:Tol biopolymer transport system component